MHLFWRDLKLIFIKSNEHCGQISQRVMCFLGGTPRCVWASLVVSCLVGKLDSTSWARTLVGKGEAKPKYYINIKSVYVCPGRIATYYTPLIGLAC